MHHGSASRSVAIAERVLAAFERDRRDASRPLILGLSGAQGSGKSTLALHMKALAEAKGRRAAVLSIDDLYFGRETRLEIAAQAHSLLATRGPPGTHDVGLGMEVLAALRHKRPVKLPRFDKTQDRMLPRDAWEPVDGPLDIFVFEGWCLGAPAQTADELADSINDLERMEDADGHWRKYVNAALAGPYQELFAGIDRLVFLAAPNFEIVERWRAESGEPPPIPQGAAAPMSIARFVKHFERITRHMLAVMPARADLTLRLDDERRVMPNSPSR